MCSHYSKLGQLDSVRLAFIPQMSVSPSQRVNYFATDTLFIYLVGFSNTTAKGVPHNCFFPVPNQAKYSL
jgi:hypothetical protein